MRLIVKDGKKCGKQEKGVNETLAWYMKEG